MTTRDQDLKTLRPEIPSALPDQATNPIEAFQHATLRPILKLQNAILVEAFLYYAKKRKNVFQDLDVPKRKAYIEQALQKDQRFREWCFGILAGQFTLQEWDFYIQEESEIRKRITTMLIQRLIDQLQ